MHQLFSVLLADDNATWRRDAARWLEENGLFVLNASTGIEAIEKARKYNLDVSILDMHMPDMTGIEIIRAFRSEGIIIPCILVSAESSQELILKALEEGAFTFLQKPVSPDLLKYTVERAIRKNLEDLF